MEVLQVKMVVLRFDVFLLESGALQAVIEQRGLFVGDDALPTCQFSLLVQKSTQFVSDCGVRSGCIECEAGYTDRIDAGGGGTYSFLEIHGRCGCFRRFSRRVFVCHPDWLSLKPPPP
jgi:hypothetical protein